MRVEARAIHGKTGETLLSSEGLGFIGRMVAHIHDTELYRRESDMA